MLWRDIDKLFVICSFFASGVLVGPRLVLPSLGPVVFFCGGAFF